jgi:hypothetical protein
MTQYLLSIYQPDGEAPPPEALARVMRDVEAFLEEARSAGALVFNGGLHPPGAATVVRMERGDYVVTDGPYIEAKEHIGGFFVLEAEHLDAALAWARKAAKALTLDGTGNVFPGLPIEVRPFQHAGTPELQRR